MKGRPEAIEATMPLFMDVHETLPARATAYDVAAAHHADLDVQQRHGVRYLRYWVLPVGEPGQPKP